MTNIDWTAGLSTFAYCLEIFIAVGLYATGLKHRSKLALRLILSIVGFYILALIGNPILNEWRRWAWFVAVLFVSIIVTYFICNASIWDCIYAVSCGFLTQHIASSFYILHSYQGELPVWKGLDYIFIYICIYALSYFFIARHVLTHNRYDVSWMLSLVLLVATLFLVIFLSISTKLAADNIVPVTDMIAKASTIELMRDIQIYSVAIDLVLLLMQLFIRREVDEAERFKQNEILWQERQRQYEISKENIDLINRKSHDLKHQIQALSTDKGLDEKKLDWIESIKDLVEVYDQRTDTGNEALDTILMEKGLYCHMHNIQWSCIADGRLVDFIDVIDLYTLLGNAIENAIEAVEKINEWDNRVISLRLWQKEQFILLQVENYYSENIQMKNGLPVTSKKDSFSHGIGISSMKEIVEKYGGHLSVQAENEKFLLNIVFPITA